MQSYKHAGFIRANTLNIHYHGLPEDDQAPFFLAQELIPGYMKGREGCYHTPNGYFVAADSYDDFERYESTSPHKGK